MFFDKKLYTSPQVQNGNSNPRKALLKIYLDECTWLKKSCPNSTVSNPQIRTVFSKISPSGDLKSAILDKEIVIFGPSNPQNSDKPLGKLPGACSGFRQVLNLHSIPRLFLNVCDAASCVSQSIAAIDSHIRPTLFAELIRRSR